MGGAPTASAASVAPSAAVIGAGLSGLTAAYRLQQGGFQVTVFEASDRAGGRVRTDEVDGYLLDTGATGLAESYTAYFELAAEFGIRDDLVPASPYIGIYRDGRVHMLRLDKLVSTGLRLKLISPWSKLRAARLGFDVARAKLAGRLDYADMRKAAPLDVESAKQYAARALNRELGEYLCEPVVRMMLISDSEEVSVVELFSGLANIFASKIYALRGGQGRLPALLAQRLEVRLSTPVSVVRDLGDAVEVSAAAVDGPLTTMRFDACVLACPLPVAAAICRDRASILRAAQQRDRVHEGDHLRGRHERPAGDAGVRRRDAAVRGPRGRAAVPRPQQVRRSGARRSRSDRVLLGGARVGGLVRAQR